MLFIILLTALAYIVYIKLYKPLHFYKRLGISYVKPWLVFGNFGEVFFGRETFFECSRRLYSVFPNERYIGTLAFMIPNLMIRDLDLIKQVTVKDFEHFTDHRPFLKEETDPIFSRNLLSMRGTKWREMRSTLSPAFTSSKMRGMFTLMDECAKKFVQHFAAKESDVIEVEMKEILTKYATDVIASTSFGIQCDSLENEHNEFYERGKDIIDFSGLKQIKVFLFFIVPYVMKLLNIPFIDEKANKFFRRVFRETVEARESQNIVRPDMIHLLMEARKGQLQHETVQAGEHDTGFATVEESNIGKSEQYRKKELTEDDMVAQALVFFIGGFENPTHIMCFMSYELVINPGVQQKLLSEVDEVMEKCKGSPGYEEIIKMTYLDQVISETLRKWPPIVQTDRMCTREYVIPSAGPNEKPVHFKEGDTLSFSIVGIHYDPKYYPNPHRFDPDRFSDENKSKIVSGSYVPFGIGPRNCIGSRYALQQIKVIFFHLLAKFELVATGKTQVPMKLVSSGFNIRPENGFQFGLKKRNA